MISGTSDRVFKNIFKKMNFFAVLTETLGKKTINKITMIKLSNKPFTQHNSPSMLTVDVLALAYAIGTSEGWDT